MAPPVCVNNRDNKEKMMMTNDKKTRHKEEMDKLITDVAALKRAHEDVTLKYRSLIGLVKHLRLQLQAYEKDNNATAAVNEDYSSRVKRYGEAAATVQLNFEHLDSNEQQQQRKVDSTRASNNNNVLLAHLAKSHDRIRQSAKEAKALRKKIRTLKHDLNNATESVSSQKWEIKRYVEMVGELQHSMSMQALESEERLVAERKASTKIINELIVNVEEGTEVAETLRNTRATLATITDEHRRKLDELERKTTAQALSEEEIINLRFTVQNLEEEKRGLLKQIELNDVEIQENRRMLSEALRVLRYTEEFKKSERPRVNNNAAATCSSMSFAPREEEATAPDLTPLKNDNDVNQRWRRRHSRRSPPPKEDPSPHCEIETVQQILSPVLKTLGLLDSEEDDSCSTTTKHLCELAVMALQREYLYRSMEFIDNKHAREGQANTEGCYVHRCKCSGHQHFSCVPGKASHSLQKLKERLRSAQLRLLVVRGSKQL